MRKKIREQKQYNDLVSVRKRQQGYRGKKNNSISIAILKENCLLERVAFTKWKYDEHYEKIAHVSLRVKTGKS